MAAKVRGETQFHDMSDFTKNLKSFFFESGLSEDEKGLLNLRARSAALTFCECAHAVFLCGLIHSLRSSIHEYSRGLRVGIVGLGHLGKQLLLSLMEKTSITASQIKVSTRRPDCAGANVPPGVECFFDNGRLAEWADVLFLCCLPSHLSKVCADLCSHLSKHSLVYSFTSAVPVPRLVQLLGHNFIIKSQHDIVACTSDMWLSYSHLTITAALKDPLLIKLSCPFSMDGGLSLGLKWVCAVLYSLVNICTSVNMGSSDTLSLINNLFKEKLSHSLDFNPHSIISSFCASRLSADEPFPWISVSDVQTRQTPLYLFLSNRKSTLQSISVLYTTFLEPP